MLKDRKWIVAWLVTGAIMVAAMVVIGGVTRLTHSGLSMTDWKLIMGMIPPMNEAEWTEAFKQYQQFPEFQRVNSHYTIEDFKSIFFWEWFHRFLGRIIGLVFIIPFIAFLIRKSFNRKLVVQSILLLGLGALQGFLGWFMVKSGLVDRPSVSHYRLAIHLCAAFGTFSYILWLLLSHLQPERTASKVGLTHLISRLTLLSIIVQIIFGAFVAGLKAGYVFPTFPKMGTNWVPAIIGQRISESGLETLFNELISVQFVHRTFAYLVAGFVIYLWYSGRRTANANQLRGLNLTMVLVLVQFTLGVVTILYGVPLSIAVAHQFGALGLLSASLYTVYQYPIKVK
jgi:cytochrome c oxidase assembly protein subunit 15